MIGVLAQGLAIQTPEPVQCFITITCHAPELQVKQKTVKVRENLSSYHVQGLFLLESIYS